MPGTPPTNHRYDDELQRRKNARPGRWVLGGVCLALAGLNVFTYLTLGEAERQTGLAWILLSELWSTVLLAAIWFKKAWARYLLAGICFVVSVVGGIFIPHLSSKGASLPVYVPANILVYFAVFLVVGYSAPIRLLTRRRY